MKLLRVSVSAEPRPSMLVHRNAISVHEACLILEIPMLLQRIVAVLLLSNVWCGYLDLSLGGSGFLFGIRLGPLRVIKVRFDRNTSRLRPLVTSELEFIIGIHRIYWRLIVSVQHQNTIAT